MKNNMPPSWARRLLRWYCTPEVLETLEGDMFELYQKRLSKNRKIIADVMFIIDVISACRPFAFKKRRSQSFQSNNIVMINHYIKMSGRNLLRNKGYALINIGGLSLALACCILIILYTKDEVSFDRFHEKQSRIYRITSEMRDDQSGWQNATYGVTGQVQGPEFKNAIPEIENYVRIRDFTFVVRSGNEAIRESAVYVDSGFLSVFSFPLLKGDPGTLFSQPNSVVMTEEIATKYFGTTDVIGKTIELGVDGTFENFTVTGLIEKPPINSTIQFGMLVPFSHYARDNADQAWINFYINTFVILHPQAEPKAVESKFAKVFAQNAADQLADAKRAWGFTGQVTFGLQPLTEIHLNPAIDVDSGLSGRRDPFYIYILTAIAVFILLIACINAINLAVAQSLKRSKEVGIRKTAGGTRKQLVTQFLGESFVTCFLAYGLAVLLARLSLPLFNQLADKNLELSYLADTRLISGFVALLLITTVAAGFYPALVCSRFQPAKVLYGNLKLTSKSYFAKSLIVLQFALSTVLIISTIVVYSQFNFITRKDLGFNDENLIRIDLPWWRKNDQLLAQFKDRLANQPSIVSVAARNGGRSGTMVKVNGEQKVGTDVARVDDNFLSTLQISFMHGRNFSSDIPSDTTESAVVNEAFVRAAGWTDPIGQTIDFFAAKKKKIVIGVIKDYHFRSLKEEIAPHVFIQDSYAGIGQMWVKISPENISETLALLTSLYHELIPSQPFEYQFADIMTARQYEQEMKWKQVIGYASILSVFISCLGLFGLTTLIVSQRTKEIGIRKVLGAPIASIVTLLSGSFVRLVLIACLIAIPFGHYAASQWLLGFAYRIEIEWWMYAVVASSSLLIALATISFQSIKAALSNPVHSLRQE